MSLTFQSSTHLLLLLLLSTAVNTHADNTNPDVFLTLCGPKQSPNVVSFYQSFVTSMVLVSGNITISGFGVGFTSAPVPVYSLGQCLNYLSSIDCQLCYAETKFKLPVCLPTTDSRIYLDGCFARYSDHNFFNAAVDGLDATQCSNSSVAASNSTLFRENVVRLMTNLTEMAEKESEYYSAGSTVASPGVTVYGVAQCWKSLNASGCRDCLESARENATGCSPASDGKALYAGCFVRYSTLPFYLTSTAASSGSAVARRRVGVVLGLVFGTLVIVVIAILWNRRRIKSVSPGQEGTEEIIRTIAASNLSFKYEDLKNATDNFSEINKLGQGGYGAVYKGVLPDGREVAVKRLFFNTRQRSDQFFNEVTFVNQVQHKNLVKLLGCSVEGPERLLVYEYLSNTSLDKFLYDIFKKNILNWGRRFNIIVGTAEGLAYLHTSSEVRIIHRDIKASNILLDERFKPKIADFGLARFFEEDQSHLSTGLAGTFGYMAPEYIVHGQLTERVDTYSYGILVIEILTGRKNQNSILTSTEGNSLMSTVWQHFNSKSLIQLLDPHLQGQCSAEEALKVFHVALLCTQASPVLRPPMWKVVEMLTIGSKDLPAPTEPPFTNIMGSDIRSEGAENSPMLSSSSQSRISENQMSMSISTFRGR